MERQFRLEMNVSLAYVMRLKNLRFLR